MDKPDKDFLLDGLLSFIVYFEGVIQACKEQYGATPLSYTYLYELLIYKAISYVGGNQQLVDMFIAKTTAAAQKLALSKLDENAPLAERIKEVLKNDNIKVPEKYSDFVAECLKDMPPVDPLDKRDEGDRLIDKYLEEKKRKENESRKSGRPRKGTRGSQDSNK